MIRYTGFTKRFGKVAAVSGLDLEVREGEALALIGPNGSGKTTTLKAALGLIRPTAGSVTVDGLDAVAAGRQARARLGYLPQRLSFPEGCAAREVMRFYARLRGADAREVDALLDRVDLLAAADRTAEEFSGGMKQRLGIAVALLGTPGALVLDEPTAALDPTGSLSVRDLVARIRAEGTTVLLSSHDLAEVSALASRLAVFVAGKLVALGTPGELVRELGLHARIQVGIADWLPDPREAAERAGARQVEWVGTTLRCEVLPGREAAVVEALRQAGTQLTEITVRTPDLEDIYRAVTLSGRRAA
ncbi:MAG TPA: ABC transporter ATP-binding protein [Longimicrobium sp.]